MDTQVALAFLNRCVELIASHRHRNSNAFSPSTHRELESAVVMLERFTCRTVERIASATGSMLTKLSKNRRNSRPPVELASEQAGDVTIVKLTGRLDAGAAQPAGTSLRQLLGSGTPRVAIDMSKLSYVSSAGLRVLLVFAKNVSQLNGKVALFDLVPEVREVFSFSGFDKIFAVHASSAAAIAAVAD